MATKAAVAVGEVDASDVGATETLTSSGFGTVDAAVFVAVLANTGSNPVGNGALNVGFWDGTSAVSCGVISGNDISGSKQTVRGQHNDSVISLPNPFADNSIIGATVSGTTDGVVLTTTVDNSTKDKRVSALLLGGLTNAKAFAYQLGTGTSYDITSIGFKPDVVFIGTVGYPNSLPEDSASEAIFSFGVAHNNSSDTVTQGLIAVTDKNGVSTTVSSSYVDHQYCAMQLYNDSVTWKASAGSFDSSGFTLTTTANPGSDYVFILALQLADPDDFAIVFDDMPTSSGSDSVTGLAFEPDAIGLLISQATANQTVTAGMAAMVGLADASVEQSIYGFSEDARSTSSARSGYSASNVIDFKSESGADAGTASLTSLNSDGWTLNYSTGGSAARKIVAFAIGDSVGGGTTHEASLAFNLEQAAAPVSQANFSAQLTVAKQLAVAPLAQADLLAALNIASQFAAQQTSGASIEAALSFPLAQGAAATANAIFEAAAAFANSQGMNHGNTAALNASSAFGVSQALAAAPAAILQSAVAFEISQAFLTDAELGVLPGTIEASVAMALQQGITQTTGPNTWSPRLTVGVAQSISALSVANLYAATALGQQLVLTTAGGGYIEAAVAYAIAHEHVQTVGISLEGLVSMAISQAAQSASQAALTAEVQLSHQVVLQSVASAVLNAGLSLSSLQSVVTNGTMLELVLQLPAGRTLVVRAESRVAGIQAEDREIEAKSQNLSIVVK